MLVSVLEFKYLNLTYREIWYFGKLRVNSSQSCLSSDADFNKDGNIDDLDYGIWFTNRN
jgi:hypothetical protein